MDAAGRIHWPQKEDGVPMLKRYLDDQPGMPLQDVIVDVPPMHNLAAERLGYSFAGKGAKRRQRLTLETIPKKFAKPKPYQQTPTNQKAAEEANEVPITAKGLKARIRRLTCQCEQPSEVWRQLQKANYPGSAVLVASVRNEMMECIKIMIDEGLIDPDDLARHRRRFKKNQTRSVDE